MIFDYDAISNDPVFVFDKRTHRMVGGATQTELDAFNRRFSIIANDSTAAFRILTPQVLEGIVLASDKLKCPVSLSFINDKIYAALSSGDSFEGSAVGDTTLSQQRERVRGEIQTVLDMVENIYHKK